MDAVVVVEVGGCGGHRHQIIVEIEQDAVSVFGCYIYASLDIWWWRTSAPAIGAD